MGFWTGLIIIVLILELVRIALSSAVLIHVLRNACISDDSGAASRPRPARGGQEILRQQTIMAVRGAMDEIAIEQPGEHTQRAVDSLGRYAETLVSEGGR